MKREALREAEKYTKAHHRRKRWRRGVTGLACVVVFCTVYALILPAITLEKTGCEIPEHIHSEACYTQVTSVTRTEPVCTLESLNLHHHGDTCYDSEGNLTCGYAAFVVHRHDSACFDENGNFWCPLPEILEHTHSDSCYVIPETDAPEVHTHTDDCYTVERGELICTEHVHTDDCYTETGTLICSLEESDGHRHDESCQNEAGEIVCGIEASEGHHHGDSCYEILRERICGVDSDHQHSDDCYAWNSVTICNLPAEPAEEATEDAAPVLICGKEEVILHRHDSEKCFDEYGNLICDKLQVLAHVHSDDCFATVEEAADTANLTCMLTEGEGAHTHDDSCRDENGELVCKLEENAGHRHSATCYGTWKLTCGMEEHTHSEACTPAEAEDAAVCGKEPHAHDTECWDATGNLSCTLEEHAHSPACYADPNADTETAADWEQTFAAVTLTGKWREDLIAIAETQLGYAESTKNYLVEDDGVSLKGYTRYGAWYSDPYRDWNAMFVSFCLHYAGIEDFPLSGDSGAWVAALGERFAPAGTYEPSPGELVFFDRDGDGTADHVGILVGITDSPEAAAGTFTTIEGDVADAVQTVTYSADEASVLGYGILPEQAGEFTLTAQTETGIVVTITGESASLPYPAGEITVTVVEVVDEESQAIRDQLLEENTEPEQRFLLEITLWHDGEEIEPTGPVTVTFGGFDTEGFYPKVYHIDTEANEVTDMDAVKDEAGDITVSTDHFSLYDVQLLSAPEGTGISGENITQIANGGKYYLTGTAYTSSSITITQDTTLDLHGYGVYYKGTDNFLVVNSGATLTIKDSDPASVSDSGDSGNLYGNAASLSFESNGNKPVKLTYYVTQSSANGTGTSETLRKYEVTPTGCIVGEAAGGAASIVKVNSGGACNLEGGLLTIKNSSSYSGDAHIIFNSGTLNLCGGYITGGSDNCWGGGIYSGSGSIINMTGGVIAANYGTNGGGVCIDSGTFTMSGGVISGNGTHSGSAVKDSQSGGLGGGVYAKNANVTISGGYLTNNSEYGRCTLNGSGCHGGGGMATIGGSLTISGGYVTGNYSVEAGGGLYIGHYSVAGTGFSMTGGTVASNYAKESEGGGIRISGGTKGVINASEGKVYITNNRTNSSYDWGGGGIFVQEAGTLNIYNSLITNNSAGGFGGGVGACPTGETLIVHKDGAAIYSNEASGTNMSGGGNGKNDDSVVANASEVFKNNGYQDYFCVKQGSNSYISLVTGEMVGGGAANWEGSCDNSPITISKTGHAAAKYLFGLTASPGIGAISSAQAVAGVIITGNSAHNHGGGIMTNGGLILGNTEGSIVTATPSLDISGTKTLLKDGAAQSSGLNYQFQLKNSEGEVVGTATADSSTGAFTISPNTEYEQTGTYTYYLTEVNDGRSGVTYDGSKYQIDVTIAEKTVTLMGVTFKSYYVDSITVNKTGGTGSGEDTYSVLTIHFKKPDGWSGVNMWTWSENNIQVDDSYTTSWPGQTIAENSRNTGWYTVSFRTTGNGSLSFMYNNTANNDNKSTEWTTGFSNENIEYWATNGSALSTAQPDGWISGGTGSNGSSTSNSSNVSFTGTINSDESYSLTINGSAFTNTSQTSLNLQLIKTDSNDASQLLAGATFLLKQAGAETGAEATTDSNGIATFAGISRNTTYYLYETMPPANYMTAGPWILEVGESTATLYPAAEQDGTLTKSGETGTALTASGSDPIVLSASISDQSWGYELPDTGGAGTQPYTMGGITLMAAAAMFLLYSDTKRRKEDAPSS